MRAKVGCGGTQTQCLCGRAPSANPMRGHASDSYQGFQDAERTAREHPRCPEVLAATNAGRTEALRMHRNQTDDKRKPRRPVQSGPEGGGPPPGGKPNPPVQNLIARARPVGDKGAPERAARENTRKAVWTRKFQQPRAVHDRGTRGCREAGVRRDGTRSSGRNPRVASPIHQYGTQPT